MQLLPEHDHADWRKKIKLIDFWYMNSQVSDIRLERNKTEADRRTMERCRALMDF